MLQRVLILSRNRAVEPVTNPEVERAILAIRNERKESMKRTKLFKLVEKLDKPRHPNFRIQNISMRFFTWLIGTLGNEGMLKQAFTVLDKVKANSTIATRCCISV